MAGYMLDVSIEYSAELYVLASFTGAEHEGSFCCYMLSVITLNPAKWVVI
jgi:hypothetical protein